MTRRESTLLRVALVALLFALYVILRFVGLWKEDVRTSERLTDLEALASVAPADPSRARRDADLELRRLSALNEKVKKRREILETSRARFAPVEGDPELTAFRSGFVRRLASTGITIREDVPLSSAECEALANVKEGRFREVMLALCEGAPFRRHLRRWKVRGDFDQLSELVATTEEHEPLVMILGLDVRALGAEESASLEASLLMVF